MFTNPPFEPYPAAVFDYFLYTTGYHFGGLLKHVYENRGNNDFYEMLLHHVCTILLQFYALMSNLLAAGSVCIWLHDVGQIPV